MGAADVVPGVSGGTIAFISGIYDTLITSIARFDAHLIHLFITGKRKKMRSYVQGNFLLSLFGGIIVAIASLAHAMSRLLDNHPVFVYAFFVGLIIASIYIIVRSISYT